MTNQAVLIYSVRRETLPSDFGSTMGRRGIAVSEVSTSEQARKEILSGKYPLVVQRIGRAEECGFDLLALIRETGLHARVVVSAETGGVEDAVRVMQAGAADFVVEGGRSTTLADAILRSLRQPGAAETPPSTHAHPSEPGSPLIGQSSSMCEIRAAVDLIAKSQTNVLITGESGTGKEVVARLIHDQSNRAARPFVAVNCAALPRDVIENELFGHERGAFTGATIKKAGCFEMADGGTLFLDEVAEMPSATQAKLLRAIELQSFRRLGGREEVTVDTRTIAATNRNISAALKSRDFREDLYYRLSVIEIFVPPLRERKEDIPQLIDYFLGMFAEKYGKRQQRFGDESMENLLAHDWPGNVRELRNVVERAIVICSLESIGPQFLPVRITAQPGTGSHISIPLGSSTHEAERLLILQTLASVGNNKSRAAKILGVSRKTLHNKLAAFASA